MGDEEEVGHCLGRLQYLNLSGCVNFTDEGLRLLLATMDGALERLDTECENSLCSTESRLVLLGDGGAFVDDFSGKPHEVKLMSMRKYTMKSQAY